MVVRLMSSLLALRYPRFYTGRHRARLRLRALFGAPPPVPPPAGVAAAGGGGQAPDAGQGPDAGLAAVPAGRD
jgi:hypothetical protein